MTTINKHRLRHIGIPSLFKDRTLGTYVAKTPPQKDNLAWAEQFAENIADSPKSALLIGKPGTGKTHLAIGIAVAAAERLGTLFREATAEHLERVHYTTVDAAIQRVKNTYSEGGSEAQVRKSLTNPRLLILDEVGAHSGSEFEQRILFSVLDARYSELRPTILVSNLNIEGITQAIGERVVDRLREHGCEVRVFDWESHRGTA